MQPPPGYSLGTLLHEDAHLRVHRAHDLREDAAVILKSPRDGVTWSSEVKRLRREQAAMALLSPSEHIASHELIIEEQARRAALVLRASGKTLRELLGERGGAGLGVQQGLRVGVGLARALAALHAARLCHGRLDPALLLWDEDASRVIWLSLGWAAEGDQTAPSVATRALSALPYTAPELLDQEALARQDARADLYALGAILYELLCGVAPFEAPDALALVHQQLALAPPRLRWRCPKAPEALEAILDQLLVKDPRRRAQSAQALLADLSLVLDALERDQVSALQGFVPGQEEAERRFALSEAFYGRAQALRALDEAYAQVAQGGSQLVIVLGASGMGKSRLLELTWRKLQAKGALVVKGDYSPTDQRPYSALTDAVRHFMQLILMEPEEAVQRWRRRLLGALRGQGAVLTDIIPELEALLGPQPPLERLQAAEAHRRVKQVIGALVQTVASPAHPLVLCLDHIQWADAASVELVEHLLITLRELPLMILGLGRPDEVEEHPWLLQAYARMSAQHVLASTITLEPMSLEDTIAWLSGSMSAQPPQVEGLARAVYAITRGSPRHMEELVQTLHQRQILRFDAEARRWGWDEQALLQWRGGQELEALWRERVAQLDPQDRHLLQLAAGLGRSFDAQELAALTEQPLASIVDALRRAHQARLVRRGYALHQDGLRWSLAHEELASIVWGGLEPSQRDAWLLHVGRWALAQPHEGPGADASRVEALRWLNPVAHLCTRQERVALLELNRAAAQASREATSYEQALEFLQRGVALIEPSHWREHHALAMGFVLEAAQGAYSASRYELAWRVLDLAQLHAQTPLEQERVALWRARVLIARWRGPEALDLIRARMMTLGLMQRRAPTLGRLLLRAGALHLELTRQGLDALTRRPPMQDERLQLAMELMQAGLSTAFVQDPRTFLELSLAMMELTLRHGLSEEAPIALAAYGMLVCNGLHRHEAGLALGLAASRLAAARGSKRVRAHVALIVGAFILGWTRPMREALPVLLQGYRDAIDAGDGEFAAYCLLCHAQLAFLGGVSLGRQEELLAQGADAVARHGAPFVQRCYQHWRALVLSLLDAGPTLDLDTRPAGDDFWSQHHHRLVRAIEHEHLGQPSASDDRAQRARLEALEADRSGARATIFLPKLEATLALGWCDLAAAQPPGSGARRALLWRALKLAPSLARWAQLNPATYAARASLVQAALLELEGHARAAARAYDDAMRSAIEHDDQPEAALIATRAARAARARGDERGERRAMTQASHHHETWDARRALARHEALRAPSAYSPEQLDARSALKVAQVLSQEIVLDRLIERLLDVLTEMLGARRGMVLLMERQQLVVRADLSVQPGRPRVSPGTHPEEVPEALPLSLIQLVARTEQRVVIDDASDAVHYALDPYIQAHRPRAVLCWPVAHQGHTLALLYLENDLTPGLFTQARQELLALISGQIATALENALLYATMEQRVEERTQQLQQALRSLEQAATTDYLTGAANRMHFARVLEARMSQHEAAPLSLILLDLDHFKAINDTRGHDAGDRVLVAVTQRLRELLRPQDTLARWGGEEFIVMLPDASRAQAAQVAERLLAEVKALDVAGVGAVSFSAGVAQRRAQERPDALIKRADLALYEAKALGRARICAAP